ncbi:hypothetical protein TNIN_238341 [Trichonephila inaurata madagascariensis]|uniref:Uncharacterized protein n=1 Tax=Trichonephila inaurata madagascariensis TaxID=2747483 RepID=A0A8X7CDJ2_9ARAC|nr:hypothetical protein TNIN_238341 [Trichonephila inaurata madagascariensis]
MRYSSERKFCISHITDVGMRFSCREVFLRFPHAPQEMITGKRRGYGNELLDNNSLLDSKVKRCICAESAIDFYLRLSFAQRPLNAPF